MISLFKEIPNGGCTLQYNIWMLLTILDFKMKHLSFYLIIQNWLYDYFESKHKF